MYTNDLNILKKHRTLPFRHFLNDFFLFLLILLKKLRILRVILEALLIQGVHQVLDFLMDLIHHVVWRPWCFFLKGRWCRYIVVYVCYVDVIFCTQKS